MGDNGSHMHACVLFMHPLCVQEYVGVHPCHMTRSKGSMHDIGRRAEVTASSMYISELLHHLHWIKEPLLPDPCAAPPLNK